MKIVKIAHDRLENKQAKTYLFRTARDLKKGQMVLTETCHGRSIGWVTYEGELLRGDAKQEFDELMGGRLS